MSLHTGCVAEVDAGCVSVRDDDPRGEALAPQLEPPGLQCLAQRTHRVALRVYGATEERAVPAVDARTAAVVEDGVRTGRCFVRVVAELLGSLRRQQCAVHRRAWGHRV